MGRMNRSSRCAVAVAWSIVGMSCASTPAPHRESAPAEPTGELAQPTSDCFPPPPPATSWDVLQGLLRPGEHVKSVEDVAGERVAVRVHDGKSGRTIWLHRYPDGGLGLEAP
jgi:hypothetical protein